MYYNRDFVTQYNLAINAAAIDTDGTQIKHRSYKKVWSSYKNKRRWNTDAIKKISFAIKFNHSWNTDTKNTDSENFYNNFTNTDDTQFIQFNKFVAETQIKHSSYKLCKSR